MPQILPRSIAGIIAAVPTPFTNGEDVDSAALRRIVRYLVEGGIHGLWLLGSGGEFPALNRGQRQFVLKIVVEEVGGRVPVLSGTGAAGTTEATRAAQAAADCGVDALFALAPYYYFYEDREVIRHILAVRDATPLPVVVYHNPSNTKARLPVASIRALCREERIIGIKDSSLDFDYLQTILRTVPRDGSFQVLQGNEMSLASALFAGADGAVLALPALAPRLCAELYQAGKSREIDRALALQAKVSDLFSIFNLPGRTGDSAFLAAQKGALELLGLCTRAVSQPFIPLNDEEMQAVRQILSRHGLLAAHQ